MFSFALRRLTGAYDPDVLMAVHMGDDQNPAGVAPDILPERRAGKRDELGYSFLIEGPACVMLPGSKSVLMVIFWRGNRLTSVLKA